MPGSFWYGRGREFARILLVLQGLLCKLFDGYRAFGAEYTEWNCAFREFS